MLTNDDILKIKMSVNPNHFDVEKLIDYLNTHEIIENDVFKSVVINAGSTPARLLSDLDDKYGYTPIPVATFIRRVPFYFYSADDEEKMITSAWLGALVRRVYIKSKKSDEEIAIDLEEMYQALEEVHYHFHISVEDIFGYMDIRGNKLKTEQFMEWYDYLKLCEQLHWYDFMPDAFIYKYNLALEAAGRQPIIYELDEMSPGEYCFRNGHTIAIQGTFPLEPNGKPVLRWIGIIIKNYGEIETDWVEGSIAKELKIHLTPRTELYARNIYNSDDDFERDRWYRLYAGPQIMEFDYTVLKRARQYLGLTQKDVAEAVGATLRTYQKWENGETTPDSKFLLRLLNWLDIREPVDATKWSEDWDSYEAKIEKC